MCFDTLRWYFYFHRIILLCSRRQTDVTHHGPQRQIGNPSIYDSKVWAVAHILEACYLIGLTSLWWTKSMDLADKILQHHYRAACHARHTQRTDILTPYQCDPTTNINMTWNLIEGGLSSLHNGIPNTGGFAGDLCCTVRPISNAPPWPLRSMHHKCQMN